METTSTTLAATSSPLRDSSYSHHSYPSASSAPASTTASTETTTTSAFPTLYIPPNDLTDYAAWFGPDGSHHPYEGSSGINNTKYSPQNQGTSGHPFPTPESMVSGSSGSAHSDGGAAGSLHQQQPAFGNKHSQYRRPQEQPVHGGGEEGVLGVHGVMHQQQQNQSSRPPQYRYEARVLTSPAFHSDLSPPVKVHHPHPHHRQLQPHHQQRRPTANDDYFSQHVVSVPNNYALHYQQQQAAVIGFWPAPLKILPPSPLSAGSWQQQHQQQQQQHQRMEHNVGRQQLTSSGTLSGHHDPHPPNHQQRQPNESIFHQKQSHPPHNINTNNAYGVQYNDPWAPFSGNFLSPALPTSTTNPTTASSERAPMSHEMDLGLSPSEASTRTNSSESSDSSALPREAGNEEDDDGFRMVGASTAAESFYAALNHVPAASMSADDGRNETKIDASIASFNVLSELDAALRDADLRATLSGRASGSSTTTTTTMTAKTTGAAMRSSGSSAMDELAILDGGGGVVTSLSLGAAEMPGSSVGNGSVDQWIMMQQSYHGEPYPSPPLPVPNHSIPYLGQPSLPLSNNEGSTMASAMSSSSSFETMSAAAVLVGGAVVASSMLQQQQQHVATNRPSAADVLEARKVQRSDSGSRRRRGGESRSIQEGTHRRHHSSSSSSTSSSHHPHNHHPYASVETHEGSSSSKINRSRSRSKYPAAYSNDKSPRHASSSPHKHNHNNHHRPSDPPSSSSSSTLTTPTTHHEGKRRSSSHPTTSGEGDNTTQTVRKSYPCTVCDKIFNRLYNQQQHLLIVHAPVRQKLFACPHPDCSKSYYRAADLQRHRRMHGSSSGGT